MKKRLVCLLLVCILLAAATGCKLSKITLVSWSQTSGTVSLKYRLSNLGNKDILSYTVYFVLSTNTGNVPVSPTFDEVVSAGSIITRTYVYTKPYAMDVTNATVSHHSASWSP